MTWRAHIEVDPIMRVGRLYMADVHEGSTTVLMEDGTLVRIEGNAAIKERTAHGVRAGYPIPNDPDALRALADALLPHHESVAAAKAETAAAKEALNVERERVDRVLNRLILER
jgi:hypothetical protein